MAWLPAGRFASPELAGWELDASAPVSSWTSCPRLGLGTAATAPRAWGVYASPFPLGNTASTPVFPVTWLFQSMAAAHQLRGTREKHIKGRLFFRLEEAVQDPTPLKKCQEVGNKPKRSPKCHMLPLLHLQVATTLVVLVTQKAWTLLTWTSLSSYRRSTHKR